MKYFEDYEVGQKQALGSFTFTKEAIIAFASQYDPQPFHVDEEAAKRGPFGALCASGWQTAAAWMKCFLEYDQKLMAERKAKGESVTVTGPSPGFRDLRWIKPVYAGDTISYVTEVKEKVAVRSRPTFGLLITRNTGTNQHGDLAFEFEGRVFVQRR